jgi:hypothetical protein
MQVHGRTAICPAPSAVSTHKTPATLHRWDETKPLQNPNSLLYMTGGNKEVTVSVTSLAWPIKPVSNSWALEQ